jgi:hypothetical protein
MSQIEPEYIIPGVELRDLETTKHPLEDLAQDRQGWRVIFEETSRRLKCFIESRDALAVLCKSTTYWLINELNQNPNKNSVAKFPLEQAAIEAFHALVLMHGNGNSIVPTSPRKFESIWSISAKNIFAFSRMQKANADGTAIDEAAARARLHTIYYRNLFNREDCERTMRNILGRMDGAAFSELGFSLSGF